MKWFIKALKQHNDFRSRARRKEFWYYLLFYLLFFGLFIILDQQLSINYIDKPFGLLTTIYLIITLKPSVAVTVRRLHDIRRSGYILILIFLPILGALWLLIQLARDGNPRLNIYGENPKKELYQSKIKKGHSDIILYDGICRLCNGLVRFIRKHHHKQPFYFAPMQSVKGQQLCGQHQWNNAKTDTIILIKENQLYTKSTAVLLILREMGSVWSAFYVLRFIPLTWRDKIYDLVAKHRYFLFGKEKDCPIY